MNGATHVIVLMVPSGTPFELKSVEQAVEAAGGAVLERRAMPVPVTLSAPPAVHNFWIDCRDEAGLSQRLRGLSDQHRVDLALQPRAVRTRRYRLAVFDMDSTLIDCEVIDELAAVAGVGDEVAAITASAMRGEVDFDESFRTRLALLKGLNAEAVDVLADRLPIKAGLREMTTTLRARGMTLAIFSGGFLPIARRLQQDFGFDEVVANGLEIQGGIVTGAVIPPIVNREHKAMALQALADRLGIDVEQSIAVGDGANDLSMMALAGMGVAFHAKPAVRAASPIEVTYGGLDGLCYLLGSEGEFGAE